MMGWLSAALATSAPADQQVAYAGAIMGSVYALGFLVIPFLPETRGVDLDQVERDEAAFREAS